MKKHGLSGHPLMRIWGGIIGRCYDKTDTNYKKYGKRGVRVCPEWRHDFAAFYKWAIENGWQKGLQIDKDIKGDGFLYSPGTCLIVTAKENSRKTRKTIYVSLNGESKPLIEWCEILELNYRKAYQRMHRDGKTFGYCIKYNDHDTRCI